jgi:single-strand DNA-binding protein
MNSSITLVGNLTRAPELRRTTKGTSVANLGLAVNRRWRDAAGEPQESTSFFTVVAWGGLAEHCATSLQRGDLVVATGRVEQRSWTTEAGEKRHTIEVVADDIGPSLRWASASLERAPRVVMAEAA